MLKLKTDLSELNDRFVVDLPLFLLAVSDVDLVRDDGTEDGSKFFSKKEVIELAHYLENANTDWRLPTLVEWKNISSLTELDEGVSDGLTGEDYLNLFGNEEYAGKELITGTATVRAPIIENATYYWSDLTKAGGAMKISPNGAAFELEHPSDVSEQHGRFYDHPDSECGFCIRLVREIN